MPRTFKAVTVLFPGDRIAPNIRTSDFFKQGSVIYNAKAMRCSMISGDGVFMTLFVVLIGFEINILLQESYKSLQL